MKLEDIRIATPCNVSWDAMTGDERVRFCGQCRLNVYNLSSMTRAEGEKLLREKEGRVCVRLYQRADGTVITQDCPVGLRMLRWTRQKVTGAAAMIAALLGLGSLAGCEGEGSRKLMGEPMPTKDTAPVSSRDVAPISTKSESKTDPKKPDPKKADPMKPDPDRCRPLMGAPVRPDSIAPTSSPTPTR